MRRLSEAERARQLDNQKWEAAAALVYAYEDWQKIQKQYGPMSQQSHDALDLCEKLIRKIKRLNKK